MKSNSTVMTVDVSKITNNQILKTSFFSTISVFVLIAALLFALPLAADAPDTVYTPQSLCPGGVPAVRVESNLCGLCGDKSSCLICATCGDGCQTEGEACDDGNTDESDNCRECRVPACQDGVSNRYDFDSHGETCEPSLDADCRPDCTKCCLLYTSPSPRDRTRSRMPSSA